MKILQKEHEQFYQGDIAYIKIREDELPKDIAWTKINKEHCVAIGEAKNSRHLITVERGEANIFIDTMNKQWLQVKGTVVLTHPEHNPDIEVAPRLDDGVYYVGRQWEYNPAEERIILD